MLTGRVLIILGILSYISINFLFLWSCQQQTTCDCSKPCFSEFITPSINDILVSEDVRHSDTTIKTNDSRSDTHIRIENDTQIYKTTTSQWGSHRLAVIVPFRNRWEELIQFVPHINNFLNKQKIAHDIWIINQVDEHRFNRAMLINIGYTLARNISDYLVMHDVDLLPLNDKLSYGYPPDGPLHIASPDLHPLYHYKKFVGGIIMMTNEDFEKINGLTNIFWGWGREDDEFYLRMTEAKLKINRPQGIKTGYSTFLHLHDKEKRPRDMVSIGSQKTVSRRRDKETGLNNLKYDLVETLNMTISEAIFRFVNVKLYCDQSKTPFCDRKS